MTTSIELNFHVSSSEYEENNSIITASVIIDIDESDEPFVTLEHFVLDGTKFYPINRASRLFSLWAFVEGLVDNWATPERMWELLEHWDRPPSADERRMEIERGRV